MKEVKAKAGQSFLDLVIQTTGDIKNAFAMAKKNGRSLTDDIDVGDVFETIAPTEIDITRLFGAHNLPATSIQYSNGITPEPLGIGTMQIENTFIVS